MDVQADSAIKRLHSLTARSLTAAATSDDIKDVEDMRPPNISLIYLQLVIMGGGDIYIIAILN